MVEFGPPPALTEDDFLDLLLRNMEEHWIGGLLEDPSSKSPFVGMARIALRLQEAGDENFHIGSYIMTAPGRNKAISVVRLQRASGAAGTIDTSRRFRDERGAVWRPVAAFDVAASAGVQTIDVPIETERTGYALNSFEALTYTVLDDLFDTSFVVLAGPDPATEGTNPFLDLHGEARRQHRSPGEGDESYRNRIRFIEDQVTPRALVEEVIVPVLDSNLVSKPIADLIANHGLVALTEPFRDSGQDTLNGFGGFDAAFCDDAFCDDDFSLLREIVDGCAWFDLFLPTFVDPNEARRFYDDDDPTFGSYYDDPDFGYPDLPVGPAIEEAIAALVDELDRRRAACVRFRIVFGEDVTLARHPPTLFQAGAWTVEGSDAPADEIEAVEKFSGEGAYVANATGTGAGTALTAGDLLYDFAAVPAPVSIRAVRCRARVRRSDVGAGVDPLFSFMVQPTGGGVARIVPGEAITHDDWREKTVILEENPDTAAPWTLADIAGIFRFGVANTAAVGATEELRVSNLVLEFLVNYG